MEDQANQCWPDEATAVAAAAHRVRYNPRSVPLSLWRSVVNLFRHGVWSRSEQRLDPIFPGQRGYADAQYEVGFIFRSEEPIQFTTDGKKPFE